MYKFCRKLLRIMKILIILMTTCLMQVSAFTYAQRISLSEKNASLISIFQKINKQSGVSFLVSNELLAGSKTVNIKVKDEELDDVLETIFEGQPLSYELKDKVVIVTRKEPSFLDNIIARFQSIDVRGKVVDSLGNGLAGATVSVKGGKGSTSTAANGDFYLKNVDEGAVLVVSYLGYVTKEVAVSKELIYLVLKQSESKLDEVVIQAYGVTTQRLATGSLVTISSKDIQKQPVNNLLLTLQGTTAGISVQQLSGLPGAGLKVQIRGKNSLNGSEPLYIVDDIPIDPGIQGIAPNSLPLGIDKNGVSQRPVSALSLINLNDIESISILKDADATSIYGSRGANGVVLIKTKQGLAGKTQMNASVASGIGNVSKKLDLLNTRQYLDMRHEAYKNDNVTFPKTLSAGNYDLTVWDTTRYTDWQDKLIGGTAKYINAQASISGGTTNLKYLISGNFQRETSVSPGDFSDTKGGIHVSLNGVSSNNRLNTQLRLSYFVDRNLLPTTDFTLQALTLAPNAPEVYLPNGEINWEKLANGNETWDNPVAKYLRKYELNSNNLVANLQLGYQLIPGLTAKIVSGYNITQGETNQTVPFSSIRPSLWQNSNRTSLVIHPKNINYSFEPQLTFEKRIWKGTFSALTGGSLQLNSSRTLNNLAMGFADDFTLDNLQGATSYIVQTSSSEYKYSALFARANYNHSNKYIINLTARNDGSSRFGPKNRFGFFGSVGAAWIFSEEKWVKDNSNILSFGKIRGSYGSSGKSRAYGFFI